MTELLVVTAYLIKDFCVMCWSAVVTAYETFAAATAPLRSGYIFALGMLTMLAILVIVEIAYRRLSK